MRVYHFFRDLFAGTSNIRKQINEDFEKLSLIFNEEIHDFEQFKEKERLKVNIFQKRLIFGINVGKKQNISFKKLYQH